MRGCDFEALIRNGGRPVLRFRAGGSGREKWPSAGMMGVPTGNTKVGAQGVIGVEVDLSGYHEWNEIFRQPCETRCDTRCETRCDCETRSTVWVEISSDREVTRVEVLEEQEPALCVEP